MWWFIFFVLFEISVSDALKLDLYTLNSLICQKNENNTKFELRLSSLEIDSTNIDAFDNITQYDNITILLLNENKIESIQDGLFEKFTYLKILDLSKNRFKNFSRDTFKGLNSLEKLDLASNQIEILNNQVFKHLISLKSLILKSNFITDISNGAFRSLKNLVYFDISNNQIYSLQNDFFHGMNLLEHIDLSNNKIKSIRENVFVGLNNLSILNLDNNAVNFDVKDFNALNEKKLIMVSRNKFIFISTVMNSTIPVNIDETESNNYEERFVRDYDLIMNQNKTYDQNNKHIKTDKNMTNTKNNGNFEWIYPSVITVSIFIVMTIIVIRWKTKIKSLMKISK